MSRIKKLHELGQSVWLDTISRELIRSGELAALIRNGEVYGVTSNPTIFEQAIIGGTQYSEAISEGVRRGLSADEILDELVLADIRAAADLFLQLHWRTKGADGFVSVEVDPALADDAKATIGEAARLWSAIDRPNVMIKIPATEAGIDAIRAAIAEGINVNVTLIFARERYAQVMEAYLSGMERRLKNGELVNHITSVASFFVSRVDTAVDSALDELAKKDSNMARSALSLQGKAAIANAKLAYAQFKSFFDTERFRRVLDHGARLQRPLWASTSTKNPAYPDTYYVDNLIGQNTVNTLPPKTLDAYRDHGEVGPGLEAGLDEAQRAIAEIEKLGISFKEITFQLERDGVKKFAQSFANLQEVVGRQAESIRAKA
jgi:transaldolase